MRDAGLYSVNGAGCPNCGAELSVGDRYCRNCGQHLRDSSARALWPLLKSSLAEATDLDGRVLGTLRLLLTRPGFLCREYQQGRRQRYLTPIGVFLLANLIYFLAPSLTDFNVTLRDQITLQVYSEWIAAWVREAATAYPGGMQSMAAAYQEVANDFAPAMMIVHVPMLAAVSLLLAFNRNHYYADHVVATLHLFAFLMLYYAALPYLVEPLLQLLNGVSPVALPVWSLAVSLQFLYVPLLLRGAFGYSWLRLIPTTAIYLVALLLIHFVYRLVQFLVVFGYVQLSRPAG